MTTPPPRYAAAPTALTTDAPMMRALARMRYGGPEALAIIDLLPLAEVAARAGYADQAHLSRDCRALTGLTPRQWRDQPR